MKINKGDWVIITTKSNPGVTNLDNSTGDMESLDGMVLQLPNNDDDNFRMVPKQKGYYWSSNQGHFRLAEPHEIPTSEPNYEIY